MNLSDLSHHTSLTILFIMTSITTLLSIFQEECCPLCYIEFSSNPAIMICTAQHVVCRTCIDKLQKDYRKCPECKQPFRAKEERSEYKAIRRLNQRKKEIDDTKRLMDGCRLTFIKRLQIENEEDISVLRKITVINSVFYYNMKQYKMAKQVLCSAFNGQKHEIDIENISDVSTQDFDPIIRTVFQFKGIKLINKLAEIYQLQEKVKNKKTKKALSSQIQPTSKPKPKDNDYFNTWPFSLQSFELCYNQYKKNQKNQTLIYDLITLYSSRPRQHKRLPNHYNFLQKYISHPLREIQIYSTIGLIIYMSLQNKHFRAMNQLDIALQQKDFVEAINQCKNKVLIHYLKEAITSSLRKTQSQSQMLIESLDGHLRQVPRVVNIEEMLFLAERNAWAFWDVMAQTYYSDHPQFKLKMAASYLRRENERTRALRLYNDYLANQKANRLEAVALIKESFTQDEEADFLQNEGFYRGEQYDSKILAEWKDMKQRLDKTKDKIKSEND